MSDSISMSSKARALYSRGVLQPFATGSSPEPPEVSPKSTLAASPKFVAMESLKRMAEVGTADPPQER